MNKERLQSIIQREGDYKEFYVKGIKCVIRRHESLKTLMGYVYLTKHFDEWGKDYDRLEITCHGGLTYSDTEGEYWVIGFDCAHSQDLVPSMSIHSTDNIFWQGTYRDMEYVESELRNIIEQLDCKLWDRQNKLDKLL